MDGIFWTWKVGRHIAFRSDLSGSWAGRTVLTDCVVFNNFNESFMTHQSLDGYCNNEVPCLIVKVQTYPRVSWDFSGSWEQYWPRSFLTPQMTQKDSSGTQTQVYSMKFQHRDHWAVAVFCKGVDSGYFDP